MRIAQTVERESRAFTLIEVLATIAIFAILLAAIDGLLFGAMHLKTRTENAVEEVLPMDRAIDIIKHDISGITATNTIKVFSGPIVGGTAQPTNPPVGIGIGSPVSLEFTTTTGIIDDEKPWGDVRKVDYSLQNSTNNRALGRDLVRCVRSNMLPVNVETTVAQRLLHDIERLQVTFYDTNSMAWVETWGQVGSDTETTHPAAIRFQIDFAVDRYDNRTVTPLDIIVPITQ